MSRGNILQGQASGKLGDTVLMVRKGQQLARVYTTSGARSGKDASEAARIQRVKFGGASNQWSLYRYVCTRMYRVGKSSRMSDYNYFVKKNNLLLPYLTKEENASGVHMLQPGVFSKGNLGRIELVHTYNPTWSETTNILMITDSQVSFAETIGWSGTLGSLKSALRLIYPYARKITYLLSVADEITVEEGGMSFASQNVNHYPVIIDLYAQSTAGEDDSTIKAYFASAVGSARLASIINGQSLSFAANSTLLYMRTANQDDATFLGKVGILVFATDDNASDCYTTILPQDGVNPTVGCYADWAGYRTASALRVAADSYGYQSGVMRDDIASVGNDMTELVQSYVAKVAKIDKGASDDIMKSIGNVAEVKAKTVRKNAVEEAEG